MLGKVALGHTANALTDSVAEVGLDVFFYFFIFLFEHFEQNFVPRCDFYPQSSILRFNVSLVPGEHWVGPRNPEGSRQR